MDHDQWWVDCILYILPYSSYDLVFILMKIWYSVLYSQCRCRTCDFLLSKSIQTDEFWSILIGGCLWVFQLIRVKFSDFSTKKQETRCRCRVTAGRIKKQDDFALYLSFTLNVLVSAMQWQLKPNVYIRVNCQFSPWIIILVKIRSLNYFFRKISPLIIKICQLHP